MKFKKIYIEITNTCNFACSFCFKSNRKKTFISPEIFSAILFSIKPYTDYLYLHVLGEPLLHPQIDDLLSMAEEYGFHINMTTNGSLLKQKATVLAHHSIRQFNISLHDAEENIPEAHWHNYWQDVISFAQQNAEKSYFSLRLWNQGSASSIKYNEQCLNFLKEQFGCEMDSQQRNLKLSDHIFLQRSSRFSWPGEKTLNLTERKCYALKDHVAILVDGTVVPCCLDADGSMALGNVLETDFEEIICSKRAVDIRTAFEKDRVVESICRDCGFVLP